MEICCCSHQLFLLSSSATIFIIPIETKNIIQGVTQNTFRIKKTHSTFSRGFSFHHRMYMFDPVVPYVIYLFLFQPDNFVMFVIIKRKMISVTFPLSIDFFIIIFLCPFVGLHIGYNPHSSYDCHEMNVELDYNFPQSSAIVAN